MEMMNQDNNAAGRSEFFQRWFAAVEALSPEESANILVRTSREEFVRFMRRTLPPEEAHSLTDSDLHALHDAMCERLQAKAREALDSWESSAPAGRA